MVFKVAQLIELVGKIGGANWSTPDVVIRTSDYDLSWVGFECFSFLSKPS